ncbi:MAG: chemotaxis protein CheW [Pseudomonadota bacterium]
MSENFKREEPSRLWIVQFYVSGPLFALRAEDIKEVVHMAELLKPPGLPSFLAGFIVIEGQAVPVVALSVLFGSSKLLIDLYTPLVILKGKKTPVALIVESVINVEPIEEAQLYPLDDGTIFNQCVSKSGKNRDGQTFYLLSPDRLLLAQEEQRIAEFQVITQKRLTKLALEETVDE